MEVVFPWKTSFLRCSRARGAGSGGGVELGAWRHAPGKAKGNMFSFNARRRGNTRGFWPAPPRSSSCITTPFSRLVAHFMHFIDAFYNFVSGRSSQSLAPYPVPPAPSHRKATFLGGHPQGSDSRLRNCLERTSEYPFG